LSSDDLNKLVHQNSGRGLGMGTLSDPMLLRPELN
jgi:hypothetical protein